MKLQFFAIFIFIAVLSSCVPKVKVSDGLGEINLEKFALLTPTAPKKLRKERLNHIANAVENELEGRGYMLLEESVIERVCEPQCDRSLLAREYGVDGFFVLTIEDFFRNDFGLGFYNTIAGTLILQNQQGEELASAEYRESERGGLLFDSGQVIGGIQDQIENSGDSAFNSLADNFANELVVALPAYVAQQNPTQEEPEDELNIVAARVDRVRPKVYRFCATGQPNTDAYVYFQRVPARLREVSNTEYCGIFRVPAGVRDVTLELRSPFGEVARKNISVPVRS